MPVNVNADDDAPKVGDVAPLFKLDLMFNDRNNDKSIDLNSQVGTLEKLYQDYKDAAKMYVVYVREAHAADSSWPVPYAKELNIAEPKSYQERCTVAERLVAEGKLTIPCLVDGMDNAVNNLYKRHRTRIFLIRKDGKLGAAGSKGPFGLVPSIEAAQKWLKEYKETGKEPEIVTKTTTVE